MKPIVVPVPKFQFGQILCIQGSKTIVENEKCDECFDGKLKVFGPKGDMKEFHCKKCNGSGHLYKVVSRKIRKEIVGMLEITTFRCELSERPEKYWSFDGVSYQGKVVWREDLEKDRKDWNVFREHQLLTPEECEPFGDFKEMKRDERGIFVEEDD